MAQKAALVPVGEPFHGPLSATQVALVILVWNLLLHLIWFDEATQAVF